MHVLFITGDERFLDEKSEQYALLQMMSEVTESLHAVVLTTKGGYTDIKLSERAWVYPTNSRFLFMQYFDGLSVIRRQVLWQGELHADVILSDDPKVAGWLGFRTASKYGRAWMVNLHDYYWDKEPSLWSLFSRYTTIPLHDLLKGAYRVIAFSEWVAIYTQSAAATEEEKAKIVTFPEVYSATEEVLPVDIKAKYPEFNYVVVVYLPRHSGNLSLAIKAMANIRHTYRRAGLVILTRRETVVMRALVHAEGAADWVRFEEVISPTLPFSNANVFLYLNGGEEEDTMLMRVAAAAALPIVAVESVISEKILTHNVNGLIVFQVRPELIANSIRHLNETPGLRELFKVNSSLHVGKPVVPNHEDLREKLRTYLTFEYVETPDAPGPEKYLFEALTKKQPLLQRLMTPLSHLMDRYTKL